MTNKTDFPLTILIKKRMRDLGINKSKFRILLGYKNMGKGINRINAWMSARKLPSGMEERIAKALQIDRSEIDKAIHETKLMLKRLALEEERKTFLPHICAMCARRVPSPIFAGLMTHNRRFYYFDKSFLELSYEEQLAKVKRAVKEHYRESEHFVTAFGSIEHYALKKHCEDEFDDILLFDTDGNLMENPSDDLQRYPGGPGALYVNNRRFNNLIKL